MNRKIIVVTGLIAGIAAIALLALPIQAYVNGTGDMLRIQEQDRLRTCDPDCDSYALQTQTQERLRTQDCNCTCDGAQTQHRYRQRTNGYETCNCTMNSEQYRYTCRNQNREGTGKP